MKRNNSRQTLCLLVFLLIFLASCVKQEVAPPANDAKAPAEEVLMEAKQSPAQPTEATQLPVRYQSASYFTQDEKSSDITGNATEEYELKVGADIFTQNKPQTLFDVMNVLADLKGMNLSWATDVDQNLPVYVKINAEDSYFGSIDNLLKQVDLFRTVEGRTINIHNKQTKEFFISLPFTKGTYNSDIGGNFLSAQKGGGGTSGLVQVTSMGNEFDIWTSIEQNLKVILNISEASEAYVFEREANLAVAGSSSTTGVAGNTIFLAENAEAANTAKGSSVSKGTAADDSKSVSKTIKTLRQTSPQGDFFIIDKSVGLITITAKPSLLDQVGRYLDNLKKELYRQVIIEAKIIEVYLEDSSKVGLDWSSVLKDFNLQGIVEFGTGGLVGQVYPWNPPDDPKSTSTYPTEYPHSFVSKISMGAKTFSVLLNALNEQGDAKVLSNPKLTVLNGQAAILSVGKNSSYISEVSSDVDGNTGTITYTAETDNVVEGIALGIMASIVGNESVILQLSPVTTDLVNDTIEYRDFGVGLSVGLPQVQVREMSTTVQIKNGEMLIIGGLIDSVETKSGKFAPVVGDIPIIRYLFGVEENSTKRRELVILLSPQII